MCVCVCVCFLIVITPYKCACILKSVDLLLVMSHKELGGVA